MKRSFAFLLIAVLILGCSSHRPRALDRDIQDSEYHEPRGAGILGLDSQNQIVARGDSTGEAVGLALAALEVGILATSLPRYYEPSTIRGRCLHGDVAFAQTPCRNVTIELRDASKKILTMTSTNETGEFAFFVLSDKIYYLTANDDRFQIVGDPLIGPLKLGADVVMNTRWLPRK